MRKIKLGLFLLATVAVTNLCATTAAEKFNEMPFMGQLFQIEENSSLNAIAEKSQGWFRKSNVERWDVVSEMDDDQASVVRKEATIAGFFGEMKPTDISKYDAIVIMGAAAPAFERRFEMAKNLLDEGFETKYVIAITGERELSEKPEPSELWPRETFRKECDVAHYFMKALTSGENNFTKMVLETSRVYDQGEERRPNSYDTLETLKALFERKGENIEKLLIVTNQPYGFGQRAMARSIFPNCQVDVAAAESNADNVAPEVIIDTLAKWLLAEKRTADALQNQ